MIQLAEPSISDSASGNLLTTGRNQRSLALDMKSEAGKAVACKLVEGADVVMENFRPGAMARLGQGYEQIKAFNPRIVYASVSGYGASGPDRDLPGQDLLLQARSGFAARTGHFMRQRFAPFIRELRACEPSTPSP